MKRTWNLVPALQTLQKITQNYCPCSYLSIGQVWWLNELCFTCIFKNTLWLMWLNYGVVKNTKILKSWEHNITFLQNKKILNLCLRWCILRSYCFVAEVTFKKNAKMKDSYPLNINDLTINFENSVKLLGIEIYKPRQSCMYAEILTYVMYISKYPKAYIRWHAFYLLIFLAIFPNLTPT